MIKSVFLLECVSYPSMRGDKHLSRGICIPGATRCSLLWWRRPANEFADGGYEIIDTRVERGVLFAQREDLLSMMLRQLLFSAHFLDKTWNIFLGIAFGVNVGHLFDTVEFCEGLLK